MNRKSKNNLNAKSGSFNSGQALKTADVTPQSLREVLSALADGELTADDHLTDADIVEMTCQDADARAAWQCMHIARDVMQADYHCALDSEFASRLSAKIELEEVRHQSSVVSFEEHREIPRQKSDQNMPMTIWKPVAGLGLAASLAGAVFLAPQLWNVSGTEGEGIDAGVAIDGSNIQQVAFNESSNNTGEFMMVSNAGTRWRSDTELPRNQQIESRLNELLTNHLEDASMGRVHGMLSHSRVVSYDTIPAENKGF